MKITNGMELRDFEPWGGAIEIYEKLEDLDLLDQLEWILEDCYPGRNRRRITE